MMQRALRPLQSLQRAKLHNNIIKYMEAPGSDVGRFFLWKKRCTYDKIVIIRLL